MSSFKNDATIKESYPRLSQMNHDATMNLEEKAAQYLKVLSLFLLSSNNCQKSTNNPFKGHERKRRLTRKIKRRQSIKKVSKYQKLSSTLDDLEKELDEKYSTANEFSGKEIYKGKDFIYKSFWEWVFYSLRLDTGIKFLSFDKRLLICNKIWMIYQINHFLFLWKFRK